MKTKLLLLFSLFAAGASAQSVTSYYGDNNMEYSLFSAATPLDHAPSGADQTWSFSGLTLTGSVTDVVGPPTGPETVTYPGTTGTSTTSGMENASPTTSKIFSKDVAGAISVTGIASDGLVLNYSTDNALVGTYPLAYGYLNSDSVAGTFSYTTYSGTFSGNVTTEVDAYGTLSLDPGPDNTAVVRVKTTQTIDLFYAPFGDVGDVTITSYSYYTSGSNSPLLRTVTTTMVVNLLSINQTRTRIEIMSSALGVDAISKTLVQVSPNPVNDVLNVISEGNETVRAIRLVDVNGRIVAESAAATINVSQLQKGMYLAMITTDSGTSTKKIVKN